jgi:hypothetical protein
MSASGLSANGILSICLFAYVLGAICGYLIGLVSKPKMPTEEKSDEDD